MTKDEAIYCMQSYLPYDEYEHCTSCPYYGAYGVDGQVSFCKSAEAHEMAINALKAEPVRHGKWIKADSQQYFRKHYPLFTCSACGYRKDSQKKWDYCPNCGARMDKLQESER